MTLHKCAKCQNMATTKTVKPKGRNEMGLWFNCTRIVDGKVCDGTFILRVKNWRQILKKESA